MQEFGKDRADVSTSDRETADQRDFVQEQAINAGDELRKRRSSRIVQAVPLTVSGVDALGRPFIERTSSLIINCHGCRYQSKHYVLKNMWVTLEIPHPETGQPPRHVRGRVAWIQRPRTVRQLFQVALELELPGNVWGIGFPPEDWATFGVPALARVPAAIGHDSSTPPQLRTVESIHEKMAEIPAHPHDLELPSPIAEAETLHLMPPPVSTTDASLQLARQVARLIADAKQQISAAAREAASQAVAQEHRAAAEQWEQKFGAARKELASETGRALERIQNQGEERSRAIRDAAAKALQNELPKWLKPHLEHLAAEITAEISHSGAQQRQLQEEQRNAVTEKVKQLCREAEEIARRIVSQSQDIERRISEHASVTSAVLESQARKQEEAFGVHHERLHTAAGSAQQKLADSAESTLSGLQAQSSGLVDSARAQIQELIDTAITRINETAVESSARSTDEIRQEIRRLLDGEIEQRIGTLREAASAIAAEIEERVKGLQEGLHGGLQEHAMQLEQSMARSHELVAQLEQLSSRMGTAQQIALEGFQSQLDDVLTLHRNELHRRSELLFDELNTRVRNSFDQASREAVSNFDEQVRALAEPHIEKTNEAISRMAGGRSLLDASLTLQQDRIRNAADEAFAESLAQFRENLGGVEELLRQASQRVIDRSLTELETRAGDVRHQTSEEIFKTAEWYEKKAQTQLNNLSEKVVESGGYQLRERAGEVSAEFAAELDSSSRNFVGHAQSQMKEVVRDSFDRARELFAEAADTTTAAFMDEIQRHARQELDGFSEVLNQTANESRKQFVASHEELAKRLTNEQEEFLRRFQERMAASFESGVQEAQGKIGASFAPALQSLQAVSEKQREDLRAALDEMSRTATGEFKSRLDNVSNTWLLTTVAKLDHQSREVVSGLSVSAEEKLRAACADVFSNVGESLRKRLQEITAEFGKRAAGEGK